MSTIAYAVQQDLVNFMAAGTAPVDPEATRLIARAQELVDTAMISSLFATDNPTDGNPTDATVLTALKKAVCAQVEMWVNSGDELDELGQWQSMSVEGLSFQRRSDDARRRERLCPRAKDALRAAQLSPGWISVP